MRFGHQWAFQKEDTRLLLGATVGFALLAAGAWSLWGVASTPVLLVLLFGGLVTLLLNLHRMRQQEATRYLEHVQALHSLYALLPPLRAPMPPLTGWAASPQLAATLVATIHQERPAHVLELGSGASTLAMAYALEQTGAGHVLAIDHDRAYARRTTELLVAHDLQERAEVVHVPLADVPFDGQTRPWYDVDMIEDTLARENASPDLLAIDGPPHETCAQARYPAVPLLHDYLSPAAVVVLDDALREDEQKALKRWQKAFDLELEMRASPKGVALLRRTQRAGEGG